MLLPSAVVALLVAAAAVPGVLQQADKDLSGGLADPLTTGDIQWSIRENRDGPATPKDAPLARTGAWLTDSTVVVAEAQRLVSYDLESGKTVWEYKSPKGEFVCDVTPQSTSKYALAAFGTGQNCSSLEAVDLKTGKQVWAKSAVAAQDDPDLQLPPSLAGMGLSTGIAVSGDTAVFDGQAYKVTDGKPLWSAADALPEGCSIEEVVGGARLVAKWTCGFRGPTSFGELDAATGRPKWTYETTASSLMNEVSIAAVDPVMIKEGSPLGREAPKVVVLDDKGEESYQLKDGHPVINALGSNDAIMGASPVLATDKILYVPGSDGSATLNVGAFMPNQIYAIDRATGERLWTQTIAGTKSVGFKSQGQLYPIRVEESGDLLVLEASAAKPMHLLRFSAADGSITNLKELPGRAAYAKGFMMAPVVFEKDGRVMFVAQGAEKTGDLRTRDILGRAVDTDMSYYRVIMLK
ncbi:PQQ-binding-like beta-propeller repeat protein [Streptodolium elevatio]|uniref:PQQ-binding-like beta-propeller repeat protein n=1 Tax=Streptodolium elevatio TaxID=3157996 RepID=A0ABV3DDU0_9ACTN